jgi:hypothetical protein
MTARIVWKPRRKLRRIEKQACETPDPVDRLRYVREQMDPNQPSNAFQWWNPLRLAARISAAIGAALPRKRQENRK